MIGEALDDLGNGLFYLGNSIWSYFSQPLEDIWSEIVSLPSVLLSGLQEMFSFLFVPSEDYFNNKFLGIREKLAVKLNVDISSIDQFKNVTSGSYTGISDFQGVLYGQRFTFVDLSFLDMFINRIHNLARGFMFPLLVFFNLNQVYFLVRGVHLFGNGGKED